MLFAKEHIDVRVHGDFGILQVCFRVGQMFLGGFQSCQGQMLPKHFKGDILPTFGLDHLQDMIRLEHMATKSHSS